MVADSLPFAQTSMNIVNGFRKTGIFPYNANIFSEDEFSPSFVTDRPDPETVELEKDCPEQATMSNTEPDPTSSTSISHNEPEPGPSNKENEQFNLTHTFSPEIVRPYPKAGPRKAVKNIKRKRKAAVLTDTPEKNALQEEQNKTIKKVKKPRMKIDRKRKKSVSKKVLQSSEESNDDDYSCLVCCEAYSESLPGETWIQCQVCKEWAHTKCAPGAGLTFVCINCNSDNDD